MAYDYEYMSHVGGTAPSPRFYSYNTSDPRGSVLGAGYFNEEYVRLKVKDIIIINNGDEAYTVRVTSVSKDSVTVIKTSLLDREFAEYHITSTQNVNLNDDGVTYTQVPNMVSTLNREFSVDGGELTYDGVGGTFLFNGTARMSSNKVADVTIALSLNDAIQADQSQVVSFTSANKQRGAAETAKFQLTSGDTMKVMLKGDGSTGTVATVYQLDLTFLEV
jgi:hypothetical protein